MAARKKREAEAALETWHNPRIDENGGKVFVRAWRTFADPDIPTDPPIYPQNCEMWLDAQKGYEWYLRGYVFVNRNVDPMIGAKKPYVGEDPREERRKKYRENPFAYGSTTVSENLRDRKIPLDHDGKPWVKVSVNGVDKYAPEEFSDEYGKEA